MELKINVPSTLNEIPLKHYQEFLKVQEGSTDEEFIAQKMIEIFCGISLSDVVNIKLKSLNELIVHFTKLFEQKTSFQQTFKIENVEFGFIPELEEISFGEYVDLESHLTSWDNYHKAMAVMYRPITKKDKKPQVYKVKRKTALIKKAQLSRAQLHANHQTTLTKQIQTLENLVTAQQSKVLTRYEDIEQQNHQLQDIIQMELIEKEEKYD